MSRSPTKKLLHLGRGEILIARFDANGVRGGYTHLGNCESAELTTTVEVITVQDFMTSGSAPYDEITRQIAASVEVTGMEYDKKVLAMMLLGDETTYEQAAGAVVGEVLAAVGVEKAGQFFRTAKRNLTLVTVDNGVGNELVLGTDYKIYNAAAGIIQILEDSPNIDDAATLTIDYTPTAILTADALEVIRGATNPTINGSFLFLPDNVRGDNWEVLGWKASIKPNGGLGLISGNDISKWKMTSTFLSDSAGAYGGSADDPFYRLTKQAAA
jgi:hypothetical protein